VGKYNSVSISLYSPHHLVYFALLLIKSEAYISSITMSSHMLEETHLLSNNINRSIQMHRRRKGHDGRINHTQTLDSPNRQISSDHTAQFQRHHCTSPICMSDSGRRIRPYGGDQVCIACHVVSWVDLYWCQRGLGWSREPLPYETKNCNHEI
jgi:hypothetical protein